MFAILFWSTNIAFSRTIMENLGTLTSSAFIYLISGAIGMIYLFGTGRIGSLWAMGPFYLGLCGTFFVVNMVSFYLAIGMACGRQQVLEVGLINYLWPSFTLLFSVPILHKKARVTLFPAMLLGFSGIALATLQEGFSWAQLKETVGSNSFPYLMAFTAAVSWGLYSCFSRSLSEKIKDEAGAVPLFLLVAGLVLLFAKFFFEEKIVWTTRTLVELAYISIFPTFFAYMFWDIAMRKGNVVLLASISYFIPMISTLISSLHLSVPIGWKLSLGCFLVIAGAVLCKWSLREPE